MAPRSGIDARQKLSHCVAVGPCLFGYLQHQVKHSVRREQYFTADVIELVVDPDCDVYRVREWVEVAGAAVFRVGKHRIDG